MKVPLLDLKAQYASIRWELREAIDRVSESQHFILGPEVAALEAEVAAFCEARFAVGVSSGTDALLASLMAVGVGAGHDVFVLCDGWGDCPTRCGASICGYQPRDV